MATKNIVPRANNEGELGTSSKKWNKVNATTITATNFIGNGSSITGVTAEWDGSHTGNATIAGNLSASLNVSSSGFYAQRLKLVNESNTTKGEVTWDSGGMHLKGDRVHFGENSGDKVFFSSTIASNVQPQANYNFDLGLPGGGNKWRGVYCQDISASTNISASAFYGVDVRATSVYSTNFREPNGNLEMQLGAGAVYVMNDLRCGINANPDVFTVDRNPGKVGVNYDLADLPAADFSVSGSTKLGEDIYDSHQFSGSLSLGNPENNAGLNIYPHGTNQVFLQPKDTTNGRINIGTGLNQTLLISAKFAGSMYPAVGTNYQFGTTNQRWGSMCTNQLTASAVTMVDTTTPATLADAAYIYAKSGEMFVLDDSGNETQISPHDDNGEWQYFSKNTKTGKVVRIRMEKMIKRLEEITGESFIEEI